MIQKEPQPQPAGSEGPRMMKECGGGPLGLLPPGLMGEAALEFGGRGGIQVWWLLREKVLIVTQRP